MSGYPSSRAYTIEALLSEGFSLRTIRYYTHIGVLPKAIGNGKNAHYTAHHLAILREIKAQRQDLQSLAELAANARARLPHAYAKET